MWVILSLSAALFNSIKYLLGKHISKTKNILSIMQSQWVYGLIILLPLLLLTGSFHAQSLFWIVIIFNSFFAMLSSSLFWKGISMSDMSLAVPLTSLTPIVTLLLAPIFIHQYPTLWGILGVLITCIGTYVLNFRRSIREILSPFTQLWKEPGLRMVLGATLVWGITSIIDKIAINLSSPILYLTCSYTLNAIFVSILMYAFKKKSSLGRSNKYLVGVGITMGLAHVTQMYAITMHQVAYVLAVINTSVLFSVLWGGIILKEKQFLQRFLGAAIMLCGVIVILLLG
jgi:drug/metabolite transporter (DMT)-like permease